ncbi:DUF1207 domain-containing protein [bacterium]|nr:DUF1207 domain-containing protein [bacterium]
MRARLLASLLLLLCAAPSFAESSDFTWVPGGRLFPVTFADPREIRTFVNFNSGNHIQASVGSYLSLFSVAPEDKSWGVMFGLEGRGYFVMRQEGGRFPLESVDGTLGLYTEYSQGPWAAQLRYTHVSAHLADGSSGTAIPYSRETLSLRGSYNPCENAQVYVGIHRLVNSVPKMHPLALQVGGNYFWDLGFSAVPFVAGDLRWQEESTVNPSFALQLGVAISQPGKPRHAFRMYYSYFTGADIRGQFYLDTRTYHGFALEFPL